MNFIEQVQAHPDVDNVIIVRDLNGMEVSYLWSKGTLHPGRIWWSISQDRRWKVCFFLSIPDGQPQVLQVVDLDG